MRPAGAWAPGVCVGLGAILALVGAQTLLAERFFPGATLATAPVLTATWLQIAAGLAFAFTLFMLRSATGRGWLATILLVGLLIRLAFLSANPILETDFNRYLWDGAVVQSGGNPWRHSPADALNGSAGALISDRAAEAGIVLRRVNHPELTTIYPPGAQLFFGLSATLGRFDLSVWRALLLVCELAALAILIRTLAVLQLPSIWIACWWINPLLAREAANTAHMDALLLPWIAAMLYCISTHRNRVAFVFIGVATAIKLWPALLCNWLFRSHAPGRWLFTAISGGLLIGLSIAPMLLTSVGHDSGLVAYSSRWDTNGGIFSLLRDLMAALAGDANAQFLARVCVVTLFFVWLIKTTRRTATNRIETVTQIYSVLLALLLLSPAGYPWYLLWLAPVAVLVPRWSFVALSTVLPLYYLRFFFEHANKPWLFDHVIPVVEVSLVLIVIWCERTAKTGQPLQPFRTPA